MLNKVSFFNKISKVIKNPIQGYYDSKYVVKIINPV